MPVSTKLIKELTPYAVTKVSLDASYFLYQHSFNYIFRTLLTRISYLSTLGHIFMVFD